MNERAQHYIDHLADKPDVIERLRLSNEAAAVTETRFILCPICNYKCAEIPIDQTDLVYVHCRKCKFSSPLLPAYFRREKKQRLAYPYNIKYWRYDYEID